MQTPSLTIFFCSIVDLQCCISLRCGANRFSYTCYPCCLFSRVWFFVTPWTVAHGLLSPRDYPGKNTGVGCHALLQGIFPTQGLNTGIKPTSLMSPALANSFFTTSTIWEAVSTPKQEGMGSWEKLPRDNVLKLPWRICGGHGGGGWGWGMGQGCRDPLRPSQESKHPSSGSLGRLCAEEQQHQICVWEHQSEGIWKWLESPSEAESQLRAEEVGRDWPPARSTTKWQQAL